MSKAKIQHILENLAEALCHISNDNIEAIEPIRASMKILEELKKEITEHGRAS